MRTVQVLQVSAIELMELINEGVRQQLESFTVRPKSDLQESEKPHMTRKETAEFFNVSLNCLNDWANKGILTPYKVGQRTYYKRSECEQAMFSQKRA